MMGNVKVFQNSPEIDSSIRPSVCLNPCSDCEKAALVAKVGCLVVMVSPFFAGSQSAPARTEKIILFPSRFCFVLKVAVALVKVNPSGASLTLHLTWGGGGRWRACVRVLRHTVMDQTGLPCSVLCGVLCVPI